MQADKSTIVDEAVNYIKKLQQTLEELEKRKLERSANDTSLFVTHKLTVQSREAFIAEYGSCPNPLFIGPEYPALFKTWSSPNVILNICGREAQISICSLRKPGLLTALLFVMEKNNLEVLSAHASSDRARSMFMIHARVSIITSILKIGPNWMVQLKIKYDFAFNKLNTVYMKIKVGY